MISAIAAVILSIPVAAPDEPIALWRIDDAAGWFGLQLNRDESCYGVVAVRGKGARSFRCSYYFRGTEIVVNWRPRTDERENYLPSKFTYSPTEDVLSITDVPDKRLKRMRSEGQFWGL
jgi:hypothetical protein